MSALVTINECTCGANMSIMMTGLPELRQQHYISGPQEVS